MKQITILMGVFCALFAVSCHGTAGHDGHDAHADHQTGEQHEPEPAHADEIVLSADKARAAGVVVEMVAAGDFRSVIPAGGVILPSTGDETSVVAPAPGVVSLRRPLVEGSAIGAGEALFTISSANLQDGDPAERAAVAYETAKKEYERARDLVRDRIVSEKEFNAARSSYETAKIAYEAVARSRTGKGVVVAAPAGGAHDCLPGQKRGLCLRRRAPGPPGSPFAALSEG